MNKRNTRKLMKSSIGKVIKRNHTYYGLPEDQQRDALRLMMNNKFVKEKYDDHFEDVDNVAESLRELHYQNWVLGILKKMKVRPYKVAEVLCHKGDIGKEMYFILKGDVGIYIHNNPEDVAKRREKLKDHALKWMEASKKSVDLKLLKHQLIKYSPLSVHQIDTLIINLKRFQLNTPLSISLLCGLYSNPNVDSEHLYLLTNQRIDQYYQDCCFTYQYLPMLNCRKQTGSVAGETALNENVDQRRTATMIALKETLTLTLSIEDYKECLGGSGLKSYEFFKDRFPRISKRNIFPFSYLFQEVEFQKGQPIVLQDDTCTRLFLIEKGRVGLFHFPKEMYRKVRDHHADLSGANRILILDKNSLVGEEGLYQANYEFTVIALSEKVVAYELAKSKFYPAYQMVHQEMDKVISRSKEIKTVRKKLIKYKTELLESIKRKKYKDPNKEGIQEITQMLKREVEYSKMEAGVIPKHPKSEQISLKKIYSYKPDCDPIYAQHLRLDDQKLALKGEQRGTRSNLKRLLFDCLGELHTLHENRKPNKKRKQFNTAYKQDLSTQKTTQSTRRIRTRQQQKGSVSGKRGPSGFIQKSRGKTGSSKSRFQISNRTADKFMKNMVLKRIRSAGSEELISSMMNRPFLRSRTKQMRGTNTWSWGGNATDDSINTTMKEKNQKTKSRNFLQFQQSQQQVAETKKEEEASFQSNAFDSNTQYLKMRHLMNSNSTLNMATEDNITSSRSRSNLKGDRKGLLKEGITKFDPKSPKRPDPRRGEGVIEGVSQQGESGRGDLNRVFSATVTKTTEFEGTVTSGPHAFMSTIQEEIKELTEAHKILMDSRTAQRRKGPKKIENVHMHKFSKTAKSRFFKKDKDSIGDESYKDNERQRFMDVQSELVEKQKNFKKLKSSKDKCRKLVSTSNYSNLQYWSSFSIKPDDSLKKLKNKKIENRGKNRSQRFINRPRLKREEENVKVLELVLSKYQQSYFYLQKIL